MSDNATIASGFAELGAGTWLTGRGQPAASLGDVVRRRRKGWFVRDRASLGLVESSGSTWFSDASRPFLTHIPCAAPVTAVSQKVLVAPAAARSGAELVRVVPMSLRGAICVTVFEREWVVMATASRTMRIPVEDGGTLSVTPESAVAWTGNHPTGFVQRLGVWDVILPRAPRGLMLHFHGPCLVWVEGANSQAARLANRQSPGRVYGV